MFCVQDRGGSIVGCGRGGGDVPKIVDSIERQGINMVFVIGGNGSHAGANAISAECASRGLKVSVVGIPKTIDNDILHIDTPRRTTTNGTPQDTDGMWYDNFLTAKKLYVDIIEMLVGVADVHFMYNPSNHDYTNGFFLADVIMTWFRTMPNVTFDCSISHRKYFQYGKNLIGTTHGDGAKSQDLPLLMAQESPEAWSNTKHRYVYTHHVHHKTSKDYIGVTVESLRSPSGTDSWHHRNGYQHNPKAVEGYIHHPEHGQVARLTHIF